MRREEYNACISKGLKGKTFGKEERKLEFCVVAKLCSSKIKDREEAERICSLPKEPKPLKASKKQKPQSCEKEVAKVAHCMVDKIDMNLASNINSIETAIINAMVECQCPTAK